MLNASSVRITYLNIVERKMGSGYVVDKWVRKVRRGAAVAGEPRESVYFPFGG